MKILSKKSLFLEKLRKIETIKQNSSQEIKPWSREYKRYRNQLINEYINDKKLLGLFKKSRPLPYRFGIGVDERIVEYPWALSRIKAGEGLLLDAGSTLNYPFLLAFPKLFEKKLIKVNLSYEFVGNTQNILYCRSDLRNIPIKNNSIDIIVCISTIEHIGLDNTKIYTNNLKYKEMRPADYLNTVLEMRRILKPGGDLLITLPFGVYENFGWMQQFDQDGIKTIIDSFETEKVFETYYKYTKNGWNLSDSDSCKKCWYHDIHSTSQLPDDGAVAAHAVACLELIK